ncbi:GrpE-domain-containing protein [Xylariaceae sp. FL0255]|nr:GrpE-domain-containing protein [Xylariaceae sp. FL0255]
MFRQALSASSRAISSTSRTAAQRTIVRSQFSPVASSYPLRSVSRTRWYSDSTTDAAAAKEGEANATTENGKDASPQTESEVDVLKKKLEAKDKEVIDWKDKYMRSVADFRNLQERTKREVKDARSFGVQSLLKDLLDTVDNIERPLAMYSGKEADVDPKTILEGVQMTSTGLLSALSKHGVERFDPDGEKFNPNEHEALFMSPMPGKEDNTVFHVQQKGFKLNGRVVRAAKVGVVKSQ